MIQNFRVKNVKDTESAIDTIISSSSLINNIPGKILKQEIQSVTNQQISGENIDTYLEKRKKLQ